MENFVAYIPTQVHFGKGVIENLGETIDLYGKKVLFIYGKEAIKRNGIYDKIIEQLQHIGAKDVEYSGIKANPIVEDADAAIQIGIQKQVEVVLAVGGGSVIDTAKIVSVGIAEKAQAWDIMKYKVQATKALPVIAVLTLAATGTEMNAFAVLQNHQSQEKIGYYSPLVFPKHSFLDPEYTFSVSKEQTINGIVDLIAHSFEAYFGIGDAPLSDRFVESIVKETIKNAPLLLNDLQNYEYRSQMMWQATCAFNGMTAWGRATSDFGVHALGHIFSLLYDISHGKTLSIAYLAWFKFQKERIGERIAQLGNQIFGTSTAQEMIDALENFYTSIGTPTRLSQVGIGADKKDEIVALMIKNNCSGYHHSFKAEDYSVLVDLML